MLYVTVALLYLLTYAVRYHCIVISSDMLYVTVALLYLLAYAVRYHCIVISPLSPELLNRASDDGIRTCKEKTPR